MVVFGGRGVVGPSILRSFTENGYRTLALSRRQCAQQIDGNRWLVGDLQSGISLPHGLDAAVHAAPLWLLPPHLDALHEAGVTRVIAFSSTSVISKTSSRSAADRDLAHRLKEAEDACEQYCSRHDIPLTILRPTMVYGYGRDANVMAIAGLIRRLGFFPVAAPARGLRQPVHADELARACLACLEQTATHGRVYALSGGEALPYVDMVRRIFSGLHRAPRILFLPPVLYRAALALLRRVSGSNAYSPAMADRMQMDLSFDHQPARDDFGFRPGRFLTLPERDLPGA